MQDRTELLSFCSLLICMAYTRTFQIRVININGPIYTYVSVSTTFPNSLRNILKYIFWIVITIKRWKNLFYDITKVIPQNFGLGFVFGNTFMRFTFKVQIYFHDDWRNQVLHLISKINASVLSYLFCLEK